MPTLLGKWKAPMLLRIMRVYRYGEISHSTAGLKIATSHNNITSTGENLYISVHGVSVRYV